MFLIDIDESTLSLWKKDVFADKSAKDFYDALDNYEIFYSFDESKQRILYEAFSHDRNDYHSFYIGDNREIEDLKGNNDNLYSFALALYLSLKEKEMSETELKEKYQENYDKLYSLSLMPKEEAQLRKKLMPMIKSLSSELIESNMEPFFDVNSKIKISYFISEKAEQYVIKMKISVNNRSYFVSNAFEFLSACRGSGKVAFGKNHIYISQDNLMDEDRPVINFLYQEGAYFNHEYSLNEDDFELSFDKKKIIQFFFVLNKNEIYFNQAQYVIDKEVISPELHFDEQGNFSLLPHLEGKLISDEKSGVLFYEKDKMIQLLSFKSQKEMIMIEFLLKNKNFPFYLFSSELCQNILPLLSDDIEVSKTYSENHKIKKYQIKYFVTYQDNDTLTFKTEYLLDDENVEREIFIKDKIGEKKYLQYHSTLEYYHLPEDGEFISQDDILAFLKEDLFALKKCANLYLSDNLVNKKVSGIGKVRIHMKSNIDWLDMDFGSDIYSKDELEQILSAYREKKKYVRLRDTFISFEEDDSQSFVKIVNDFSLSSLTEEKLPLYDALKLSTYQDDDISVIYSKELKELFDEIKNFQDSTIDLDDEMASHLRKYQLDGVKWLHCLAKHNLCGILADDMGLGKTLEIIALLSLGKEEKPILIVSPKSLIYNWENEFKKWNPKQPVFVFDGNKNVRNVLLSQIDSKKKEVYIVSYDSLRNDLDEFVKFSFSYLILDEGQNISNVYAKKTKAVKEIMADHKFVLTGTPIQNSLVDLWSIFDFLMPGYLSGFHQFSTTYGKLSIDNPQEKMDLMSKIAPFVLKRTKKEVLDDLPSKEEQSVMISLSESQQKLYNAYIQQARTSLDKGADKITILAEITRLREICVDPSMFIENYDEISQKITSTIEMVKSAIANQHKVLIFSCFVKTLLHLKEILEENDLSSYLISGETKAKDRVDMAEDFNTNSDVSIMLVSLKAGGTGLNLIGADIVIHLDPWWNVAAEEQASDRAYRIGQKRNVTILKLVCKNTIEERVIELQKKKKLLTSVIQEGDIAIKNLNTDDFRYLLS